MARIGDFDPNAQEPNVSFDPLPAGWYAAQIVKSDMRPSKSDPTGKNAHLWLELELLEEVHPDLKGRKVWDRLNLYHSNEQTVKIARASLTAICRAIGVNTKIDDSEVLHFKPLAMKLRLRAATDQFEASNDVRSYDALTARFPNAQVSAGARPPHEGPPQTPAQPAGDGKPPWLR